MQATETTERMATVDQLVADASATLAAAGVSTARLDAEVLLAAACGIDRTALYLKARDAVPRLHQDAFQALLARRSAREPLQYILGRQEWWSLDFFLTPDVLIPRPETERLVELTLSLIGERSERSQDRGTQSIRICDLGTGSGCIAIALARALPDAEIWALDVASAALAVARYNAQRHAVAPRIRFALSDVLAAVEGVGFDVIVANPPYVATGELAELQPELQHEPRLALDGGESGLDVIRHVVDAAPESLCADGWLVMEIGATQEGAVTALARRARFQRVSVERDYTGLPRVLLAGR